MSNLKSCPFCGSQPELDQIGKNKVTIKCPVCKVEMTGKVLRNSIEWLTKIMITRWNTRTDKSEFKY